MDPQQRDRMNVAFAVLTAQQHGFLTLYSFGYRTPEGYYITLSDFANDVTTKQGSLYAQHVLNSLTSHQVQNFLANILVYENLFFLWSYDKNHGNFFASKLIQKAPFSILKRFVEYFHRNPKMLVELGRHKTGFRVLMQFFVNENLCNKPEMRQLIQLVISQMESWLESREVVFTPSFLFQQMLDYHSDIMEKENFSLKLDQAFQSLPLKRQGDITHLKKFKGLRQPQFLNMPEITPYGWDRAKQVKQILAKETTQEETARESKEELKRKRWEQRQQRREIEEIYNA